MIDVETISRCVRLWGQRELVPLTVSMRSAMFVELLTYGFTLTARMVSFQVLAKLFVTLVFFVSSWERLHLPRVPDMDERNRKSGQPRVQSKQMADGAL